jgi:hypothetical protein
MTDAPENNQEPVFRIQLPDSQHAGVLADMASIWRTDGYFVLDFVAQQTPVHPELIDGQQQLVLNSTVVSRVKILPSQILPIIEALQQQSNAWIEEQGRSSLGNYEFPTDH